MNSGWYILNYHDINWELPLLFRRLGGTVPPDVFRGHIESVAAVGELISVQEGLRRCRLGLEFVRPAFSFWFDDGLIGVRRYGMPICREYAVTGAVAACSRFALRDEMFWRFAFSLLLETGSQREMARRFVSCGWNGKTNLWSWTLDEFSDEVLAIIQGLYNEKTSFRFRQDSFRVFDTAEGLAELTQEGWLIANHTAAHYPVTLREGQPYLLEQFLESESFVRSIQPDSSFWVLPFEKDSSVESDRFYGKIDTSATIVRVCNRINTVESFARTGMLYRIAADWMAKSKLPFQPRSVSMA